ncbi:hypothetical protein AABB24_007745, partial [Solanum stoloniferum]
KIAPSFIVIEKPKIEREMHLWPSLRLRDSFKLGYLKNLEWNLHRMNSQKQRDNDQKLLDEPTSSSNNGGREKFELFCREFLMILSCCYCCFCCGEVSTCIYLSFSSVSLIEISSSQLDGIPAFSICGRKSTFLVQDK